MCQRSLVEVAWSSRDSRQGAGQLWLAKHLTLLIEIAAALKDALRFRKLRQLLIVHRLRFFVGQPHSVASQPDRGLHNSAKRQFAPVLLRINKTGYRPRHSYGLVSDETGIGDHVAICIEIHVALCGFGCFFPVVEKMCFAIRSAEKHESATADVSCGWMYHR